MTNLNTIAIISDSICGPLLCYLLEQKNIKCKLINTDSSGINSYQEGKHEYGYFRIPYFPKNQELIKACETLQPFFADKIILEEYDCAPTTVTAGEHRAFVGFGDSKAHSVTSLSTYNFPQAFGIHPDFISKLATKAANIKAEQFHLAELTSFELQGSRLESITINGQQQIFADAFVFLNSPKDYLHLLPSELVSNKLRNRVTKSSLYARIALRFEHDSELHNAQNLIFMVPDSTEIEPCVGYFGQTQTPDGHTHFHSVWETYVDQAQSEDSDFLLSNIKNLRRLAKRAVPGIENKCKESIAVFSGYSGDWAWVLDSKEFQEMANNLMITPRLAFPLVGTAQNMIAIADIYEKLVTSTYSTTMDAGSSIGKEPTLLQDSVVSVEI